MARLNSKKKHTPPASKNQQSQVKTKNSKSKNNAQRLNSKDTFSSIKNNNNNGVIKKTSPFIESPIYDLLHSFEKAPDQWAARYIVILSAIILRSTIGLGSFSGKGQGPINGDFEAQRHWMELTINLPIKEWYFYDLEYWGLDYPPLTAFHSWFFGKIGSSINSNWFQFFESRGLESNDLKNFMRFSSLISELVIYIPALLQFISIMGKKLNLGRMDQTLISAIIISQPSLILIDHGHFQYNSVMLGLFLLSLIDLIKGNLILASIWFILSILFKQMALYYAPFIFFYILSKLFTPKFSRKQSLFTTLTTFNIPKLILIGITIIITIIVILLPFIITPILNNEISIIPSLLQQIITRMFPFQRGLFEDKVANFWCTSNLIIKYNKIFTAFQLQKLSLVLTILSILPPCLMIFIKNLKRVVAPPQLIIYGFSATAWGFFLFSFQVHEKTVLVPLIPSTLLYILNDRDTLSIIQWINNIATFSLFPLLKKDDLALQYGVMAVLNNWLIGGLNLELADNLLWPKSKNLLWKLIISLSYLSILAFHIVDYSFSPPSKFPDLWVISNTTISFGCFGIFYLWLLYKIYHL